MKRLVPPPGLTEASCFGWGESGLAAGALEVPAPEGCCAEASAGMARAASHKAKAREKKSGVRSEIFCNINSPLDVRRGMECADRPWFASVSRVTRLAA